ncbi:MAG: NADH-quinone oxidoreductase subunit NuoF [Deltaproteobacteria bacterium]|nr:NADH-quinone oxidoreductase subunit NuoF [Deltaproteobacteria bacterium]MBW1871817.1 NADH-quinone oxidoreductase subunit NuoF [Deltaproteobacteria bacterium]
MCFAEPLVDIKMPGKPRVCYSEVTPKKLREILNSHLVEGKPLTDYAMGTLGDGRIKGIRPLFDLPVLKPQVRIALRNCGIINPAELDHYLARDGYQGLQRAIKMKPEEVIEEVVASGLRGRGGGGFPTGLKWKFCRAAEGSDKYLICNADEGDPGAFMDRSLLEGDPHAVLEGMCIAAYAIGASHGYIYIRAEYPLAIERLKAALRQMREVGLLGESMLGSGFGFDIIIKEGAGAFVCGEETALIASIEGERGMPRSRPPFPAIKGLFSKPSNINNVETFANVASILREGAEWFASFGTEKSKGTKTFALAGKISRPGLIEVPMGMKLGEVVNGIGGGVPDGGTFKAAQTGGPSGGCLPALFLDTPIDYESLAKAGSIMGSGGLVVTDENTCMVDLARYFLTFTQNESCGKCTPCRLGTKEMLSILERICAGEGKMSDIELLGQLGVAIKGASLCGLGQTAPNPALTTLKYFREEYEEHIIDKKCRAKICKELLTFTVITKECTGCMLCAKKCPSGAISGEKKQPHSIDQSKCTQCGVCADVCRFKAILVE